MSYQKYGKIVSLPKAIISYFNRFHIKITQSETTSFWRKVQRNPSKRKKDEIANTQILRLLFE